ncbi:MAG: Nif3-like dinuclear metal center hexameric protein [Gemmatimonadetes bacterium]|nr:Nif3-like dinuclear metal center hexameric protein [Gemmatimonadota bacterium]
MTAGEVLDRIKQNLGVPWRDATYRDTFKFGGPDTVVTGIATTAFVSIGVIERAAVAGLNMIIAHEVTYWNDRDDVSVVSGDPLYVKKVELMRKHDIVAFRMHDHMHAQRPDRTYMGSARNLGLEDRYETAPGSHRYVIPETTLGALAADVRRRTGARAIRVVGDPDARVSRIQLGVGYATSPADDPAVDVVVSGEQQEADGAFDSPEYVLDAAAFGIAKGWIMLGHVISEEPGMLELADWIRGFVPEVPVRLIEAGEPFWSPR